MTNIQYKFIDLSAICVSIFYMHCVGEIHERRIENANASERGQKGRSLDAHRII